VERRRKGKGDRMAPIRKKGGLEKKKLNSMCRRRKRVYRILQKIETLLEGMKGRGGI